MKTLRPMKSPSCNVFARPGAAAGSSAACARRTIGDGPSPSADVARLAALKGSKESGNALTESQAFHDSESKPATLRRHFETLSGNLRGCMGAEVA
jgi:hypothetical protein